MVVSFISSSYCCLRSSVVINCLVHHYLSLHCFDGRGLEHWLGYRLYWFLVTISTSHCRSSLRVHFLMMGIHFKNLLHLKVVLGLTFLIWSIFVQSASWHIACSIIPYCLSLIELLFLWRWRLFARIVFKCAKVFFKDSINFSSSYMWLCCLHVP